MKLNYNNFHSLHYNLKLFSTSSIVVNTVNTSDIMQNLKKYLENKNYSNFTFELKKLSNSKFSFDTNLINLINDYECLNKMNSKELSNLLISLSNLVLAQKSMENIFILYNYYWRTFFLKIIFQLSNYQQY
jgi:hypothetical protein